MRGNESLVGKFHIRETEKSDMVAYLKVCQKSAQQAYASKELGISKKLFSLDNFMQKEAYEYWQHNFTQSTHNKSYVAIMDENVVGGISAHKHPDFFELNGYYVLPQYQGKGIGSALWASIQPWMSTHAIELEVFSQVSKTIALYESMGFKYMGHEYDRLIHWSLWPPGQTLVTKRYRKDV